MEKVIKDEFSNFQIFLERFLENLQDSDEEYNKIILKEFLEKGLGYNYEINTKDKIDLAIYKNNNVEVLFELKAPKNKNEMITSQNLNKKALHESLLYYLREKLKNNNYHLKHIIISNYKEWYIFDAVEFNKLSEIKEIEKLYKDKEIKNTLFSSKNNQFYKILEQILDNNEILNNIKCQYIDLTKDKKIEIYKLLSPKYLLKEYFQYDSSSLNRKFYYELLYILGLKEVTSNGRKIIKRANIKGSLLENTILKLKSEFGIKDNDKLFEIGLELNITWLNRILFLKLLEAKLLKIHTKYYRFLSFEITKEFDSLNTLFFEVLAYNKNERESIEKEHYKNIPYLNSSLFETTPLERKYLRISNLRNQLTIKKFSNSVLTDEQDKLHTLEYFLKFLNSYDFGTEDKDKFKQDRIISPAVLGLIFEKLNGYKDGSFFTPSSITIYMARETIKKVVIDKFNQRYFWNCENLDEVYNKIEDIKEANKIINSITICDPAVGSGHFLVSVLNELLVIKSELGILIDKNGKRLRDVKLTNKDDELHIFYDGELFEYKLKDGYKISDEKLRIQKTIFNEKLQIIENQLFGVDINPNSVNITRLRLWIELLKDSYYENKELVTLPNIDINIKCGNSLVSRFDLYNQELNQEIKEHFKNYKQNVNKYKNISDKFVKYELEEDINSLKKIIYNFLLSQTKEYQKVDILLARFRAKSAYEELAKLDDELILWAVKTKTTIDESLFGKNRKERKELFSYINKAFDEFKNVNKKYKNSFEWRFEFPEVLNDDGEFIGFDVVIGNPPYISNRNIPQKDKKLYEEIYGLSDDLYNYFFIKGFEIAKKDGLVGFITSNTFMTINSKINIRELLQSKQILEFIPIKNPFEEATVEPIIVLAKNQNRTDYQFDYIDLRKEEFDPTKNRYKVNISTYQNTPNKVFFTPTNLNLQIYSKYMPKVKELLNNYWDKISTSINIATNRELLANYRKTLKAGDVTLLGLVTNGGQGLATANNGKYIGVKEGTKEANKILQTRKEKIKLFNQIYKKEINIDNLEELEIRKIFDSLKVEYGRDVFGQGYIYRIVSQNEIADVNSLSQEEKQNGIVGDKTFIPYDKGDRDGNKWYYETPFYIDWSRENVQYLKKDKKARFQGYNFYFKEGFSWSDIHTIEIKSRLKSGGVYDVTSMSLFSISNLFSDKFFITILNSSLISNYSFGFVNNTPHFQINDARQIPIIVPTPEQLKEFEEIFDKAKEIKIKEFSSQITKEESEKQLNNIQKIVDKAVYKLYDIKE